MKASVQNLQPYVPEKPLATLAQELGLARVVRLSANENPYGTSPAVAAAVKIGTLPKAIAIRMPMPRRYARRWRNERTSMKINWCLALG